MAKIYTNEITGACKEDVMGKEQVTWLSGEHIGSRTELPVPHNVVQQPVRGSAHSAKAQEGSPGTVLQEYSCPASTPEVSQAVGQHCFIRHSLF